MNLFELYQQTSEGVNDPHIFKAVFMAGSPGSGKTTVANKLFAGTGLKQLNVDKFWQMYNKKGKEINQDQFRKNFKIQSNIFTKTRLGLLIDGTARNPDKMASVKQELESIGYDTAMVFVNIDLDTSIARAENRAASPGPDQGRVVDREVIKDIWQRTQQSLGNYQNMFGRNFYIIDSSNDTEYDMDYADRQLRKWLNSPPRNPTAIQWMKDQRPQ